MQAQELNAFFKEAGIEKSGQDVLHSSVLPVLFQAKNIIKEGHGSLLGVIMMASAVLKSEAFKLGFLGQDNESRLKTFAILSSAWAAHTDQLIRRERASRGESEKITHSPSAGLPIADEATNVLRFPIEKTQKAQFQSTCSQSDVRKANKLLTFFGFNLKSDRGISMEESAEIFVTARSFFNDAFENAVRADTLIGQLMSSDDQVHAFMSDDLLDMIMEAGAKNRAWILHTRKTIVGRSLILGGGTESHSVKCDKKTVFALPVRSQDRWITIRDKEAKVLPTTT